jgi:hypothetical protein
MPRKTAFANVIEGYLKMLPLDELARRLDED